MRVQVLWACGRHLANHLCEAPELIQGKRCIELGAGIGLTGIAAAALGASEVVLTDVPAAMSLLRANAAAASASHGGAAGEGCRLIVQELLWGEQAHIEQALSRGAYEVVLGADILYFQSKEDVVKLVATMDGLLAAGGAVLLAYEWREDWETTDAFHCECAARGLHSEQRPLRGPLGEVDEDEAVLLFVSRGGSDATAANF